VEQRLLVGFGVFFPFGAIRSMLSGRVASDEVSSEAVAMMVII